MGMSCPRCGREFETGSTCTIDGSPLIRKLADPFVGRVLGGRFKIQKKIGAGSMGAVYQASQVAMSREVAVKILKGDRALDDQSKARFLREARANSVLTSPHTVTVFDFGESDTGDLYLAMELLSGESLGERLTHRGRLSIREAIETTKQALRSLAEAHGKGIIHRDLKPDNLFFARVSTSGRTEEVLKVLDFGIAKMIRQEDRELNAVETQAGTVFGTPRFMSPEQAQGKSLDVRSDLYSLGVILYHMLTGNPPYTDDDAILVMARHIRTPPVPPSQACPEAEIPPELERFVLRVLAKTPEKRPRDADAMIAELHAVLSAIEADGISVSETGVLPRIRSIPPAPTSLDDVSRLAGPDSAAVRPVPIFSPSVPRRNRSVLFAGGIFLVALLLIAGAVGAKLGQKANAVTNLPTTGPAVASTSTPIENPAETPPESTIGTLRPSDLPSAQKPANTLAKPVTGATRGKPVPSGSASYEILH
jgi:eukaryotic-like serine/threonine-protein kinase